MSVHVLTVNAKAIHEVDTANPTNVCGIWTVFSRCADSLKQGRRLENLSWRLRQKEQFVNNTKRLDASPQLSSSVDSLLDEDTTKLTSYLAPLKRLRPRICRLDSTSSLSRCGCHIRSDDFKQMLVFIVDDNAPVSAPTVTFPLTTPIDEMTPAAPDPIATGTITQKKAPAKFALGGSCSSSEQGISVELSKTSLAPAPKKAIFQIGGSSESVSTKSSIPPAKVLDPQKMRHPVVSTRRNSQFKAECAIDSDTEDDYVNESTIDDYDDSSDWEDSMDGSGKSSVDHKFFQRVESKANLISRPSLITLMLAEERQKSLSNQASHSASASTQSCAEQRASNMGDSPNGFDEGPLMMNGMRPSNLRPIIEVPRSSARTIVGPINYIHAQAALSPRATRRNMLATELTESLRRHLLWERQQKNSTANAVLKRGHTSHDVANLRQFPEKPYLKQSEDANANSWNQYFNKDTFDGYHSKGW